MSADTRHSLGKVKVRELSLPVAPRLRSADADWDLYEISPSTLTIFAADDVLTRSLGREVPWNLHVNGVSICDGRAEVAATSPWRNGHRVTLQVSHLPLDLSHVIRTSRAAGYRHLIQSGVAASDSLVPSAYKAFCADVSSSLKSYCRLTSQIGFDARVDEAERPALLALFEECTERMLADWAIFLRQGTEMVEPWMSDSERVTAVRAFTHRLVTAHLMDGAVFRRAVEKPRGYPGDYGVMNYLYQQEDIGETAYGRLCHRLGLWIGACVRTRKDVVRQYLGERLAAGAPLRVTSVACGSAQEIFEIVEQEHLSAPLTATLMDQDTEALEFATARLGRGVVRHGGRFAVHPIPAHFGDYTGERTSVPEDQDVIYCFGMLDYLPDDVVQAIASSLYSKLKGGGCLILGNVRQGGDVKWGVTTVIGYDMWFRTDTDLLAVARLLPGARAELKLESTGNNYLLFVHKT